MYWTYGFITLKNIQNCLVPVANMFDFSEYAKALTPRVIDNSRNGLQTNFS